MHLQEAMRSIRIGIAVIAGCVLAATAAAGVPSQDIRGSQDSALVSRFPGSTIIGYHTTDFDQAMLPLGKFDSNAKRFTRTETVAGKITDIAYAAPEGKSSFEVFQNYHAALARAGFVIRYQCDNDDCTIPNPQYSIRAVTSHAILPEMLRDAMAPTRYGEFYPMSMINLLSCNGGELHVETARLARAQGNVDASLMVCGNTGERVGVLQRIVEAKPMQTGQVTVNARAMGEGLAQNGHIALYGIHFATDSAALASESDATLAQMVTLLKSQPALKVFIVGHTDNTGTLAHNLALSQARADAVVKALETGGIARTRLAAKGLASYAPVASNDTDAGRAQNRRVELVEQ